MRRSLGSLGLPVHHARAGGSTSETDCAWCGKGECAGSIRKVNGDEHFCCNDCERKGAYRTPPDVGVARETEAPAGPKIPMKAIKQPGKKGAADVLAGLADIGKKKP